MSALGNMLKLRLRSKVEKLAADPDGAVETWSRVTSLLALGLMILGMSLFTLEGYSLEIPGEAAVPLSAVGQSHHSIGLDIMSGGIVLLCLLPALRIALNLGPFLRRRATADTFIAIVVLVELLLSMLSGR